MFLSFGFQESKTQAECVELEKYARTLKIFVYIFFGAATFLLIWYFWETSGFEPRELPLQAGALLLYIPIIDNFTRDIFGQKLRTTPFLSDRGILFKTKPVIKLEYMFVGYIYAF
jgi:hypothetical protein